MAKKTKDALEIVDRRYFSSDQATAELEDARGTAQIARDVFQLRTSAELTQQELAKRAGTTHSVIARVEDDGYDELSLTLLHRVAHVLNKRIEIRFLPLARRRTA